MNKKLSQVWAIILNSLGLAAKGSRQQEETTSAQLIQDLLVQASPHLSKRNQQERLGNSNYNLPEVETRTQGLLDINYQSTDHHFTDVTDWQQVEATLKESDKHYKYLYENIPVMLHSIDNQGKLIAVSNYWLKCLGYERREVIGRKSVEFITPESRLYAEQEALPAYFKTGVCQDVPYQFVKKNGEIVDVLLSAVAEKDQEGNHLRSLAVITDITKRKKVQASLAQSEAWYKALIRESTDMIDVLDRDGNYIYVNPSRYLDIGIEPEELIGTCCWDAVHPEDMPAVKIAFSQILQNPGKPVPVTIRIFLPDESFIYLEVIGRNLLDDPAVGGIVINSRDVTERKLAEAKLQEAVERDRLLGEIATHIRQSLHVEEVLHTTVEEVRQFLQTDRVLIKRIEKNQENKQICKVVAESINPQWLSCRELSIRDENYTQEIIALFKDSDFRAVEDVTQLKASSNLAQYLNTCQIKAAVAVSIIVDEQMYGMLVASQCSSTRSWQQWEIDFLRSLATQVAIAIKQGQLYQQTTKLNQQLLELNANLEEQVEDRTAQLQQKMLELEELNRVKDIFLHAVSHDLRTPILAALMVLNNLLKSNRSAQTAAESSHLVPVARSVLERMAQSSDRQLSLINSLLEVHSTKMQGVSVNCSPLKLSQLVLATITDLEPIIVKNQAVLTNLLSDNLPMVSADAIQLRRVFENLIINALQHNPPPIELTISATVEKSISNTKLSKTKLANSSFCADRAELNIVRCAITDNGVGIAPEQCSQLFELYYQAGKTRCSTGVGLGLYLCRQIIKAHSGEIGVESHRGAGTTFWFTLPLAHSSIE